MDMYPVVLYPSQDFRIISKFKPHHFYHSWNLQIQSGNLLKHTFSSTCQHCQGQQEEALLRQPASEDTRPIEVSKGTHPIGGFQI